MSLHCLQAKTVEERKLWAHHIKRIILENHHAIIPQKVKNPTSIPSIHTVWLLYTVWPVYTPGYTQYDYYAPYNQNTHQYTQYAHNITTIQQSMWAEREWAVSGEHEQKFLDGAVSRFFTVWSGIGAAPLNSTHIMSRPSRVCVACLHECAQHGVVFLNYD